MKNQIRLIMYFMGIGIGGIFTIVPIMGVTFPDPMWSIGCISFILTVISAMALYGES